MKGLGNSRGWVMVRWLSCALAAIWSASMSGQTTATVTPITYARPAVGMLQAADKNFYAPSLPIFETFATDATHVCSCIYKVTPKWDRVDILFVLANRPLNEPEPDE